MRLNDSVRIIRTLRKSKTKQKSPEIDRDDRGLYHNQIRMYNKRFLRGRSTQSVLKQKINGNWSKRFDLELFLLLKNHFPELEKKIRHHFWKVREILHGTYIFYDFMIENKLRIKCSFFRFLREWNVISWKASFKRISDQWVSWFNFQVQLVSEQTSCVESFPS